MEAVADDFAGIGNGDEGGRFVHTDEVAQFDCLRAAHNGDDHGFLFFFVAASRLVGRHAALERVKNKV